MASSVAEVFGLGARDLRLDAGVTLEEMARAARDFGLPWSSGRVGDFEAGRTAPTVPTLVAVTAALGKAIGRRVALSEMIPGRGQVQINDELTMDRSALRALLSGEILNLEGVRLTAATLRPAIDVLSRRTPTDHWPHRLREVSLELRSEVLRKFSESDTRMCKNLSVDPFLGAAAMAALWRRTFSEERGHRAGPEANPQAIGQISRRLKAELQKVINDGNN